MPIAIESKPTFKEFVEELRARKRSISVVRIADHGLVEPAKRGGAWVMQPMVRLVASALDRDRPAIITFEEKNDASKMVTIVAGADHGRHQEQRVVARKDDLRLILLEEGFPVEDGEWTPKSAEAFIAARTRALG